MTRALSTRLKLYGAEAGDACPIYAFDTPGLMMPFLGNGIQGRERAVRLALIAALKEGMYDYDFLATYLVHRLNFLDPEHPAYLPLLAPSAESKSAPPPPTGALDAEEFLEALCQRRGMVLKGARPDVGRAAQWFVQWWREHGALVGERTRRGWGFDFDLAEGEPAHAAMERRIVAHFAAIDDEARGGERVSVTQERKRARAEEKERRRLKRLAQMQDGAD